VLYFTASQYVVSPWTSVSSQFRCLWYPPPLTSVFFTCQNHLDFSCPNSSYITVEVRKLSFATVLEPCSAVLLLLCIFLFAKHVFCLSRFSSPCTTHTYYTATVPIGYTLFVLMPSDLVLCVLLANGFADSIHLVCAATTHTFHCSLHLGQTCTLKLSYVTKLTKRRDFFTEIILDEKLAVIKICY
jgi:hypothetical protein